MSQTPVVVSPMIKFGRWSMLTLGIVYGAINQKRLSKKENKVREIEAKQKIIRDKKLTEERRRIAEAEVRAFALLSGKMD